MHFPLRRHVPPPAKQFRQHISWNTIYEWLDRTQRWITVARGMRACFVRAIKVRKLGIAYAMSCGIITNSMGLLWTGSAHFFLDWKIVMAVVKIGKFRKFVFHKRWWMNRQICTGSKMIHVSQSLVYGINWGQSNWDIVGIIDLIHVTQQSRIRIHHFTAYETHLTGHCLLTIWILRRTLFWTVVCHRSAIRTSVIWAI